jgi:hypothetical protein
VESKIQLKNNLKVFKGVNLSETVQSKLREFFKDVPQYVFDPRSWGR